jgi:hypothetical protein
MKTQKHMLFFLNFSKAFDKVNRVKLLFTLIKGTNPRIWLLIKNYHYQNLILHVSGKNDELSGPFSAGVGVKQARGQHVALSF